MAASSRAGADAKSAASASSSDIAFLLIVFFMVTSVFSATKGLDLERPEDELVAPPQAVPAVLLQVLEDGSLVVDGRPRSIDELPAYLASELARWPDRPVILRTRPEAPYRAMVDVYDTLCRMHVPRIEGGLEAVPRPLNVQIPTERDLAAYRALLGSDPFGD